MAVNTEVAGLSNTEVVLKMHAWRDNEVRLLKITTVTYINECAFTLSVYR